MTPAVTKIMEQLNNERVAIANCSGAATSCLDQMSTYYGLNHGSLNEFALKPKLHSTTQVCPSSMQHRHLLKDLSYVLVPWYELGCKAGLESPFIRSLILWSPMINGTDYLGKEEISKLWDSRSRHWAKFKKRSWLLRTSFQTKFPMYPR
jgi:opine dehydrogenase